MHVLAGDLLPATSLLRRAPPSVLATLFMRQVCERPQRFRCHVEVTRRRPVDTLAQGTDGSTLWLLLLLLALL